jgi:mannose-6-phosphate isomerase-like protein (cupin superfamily)
MVRLHSVALFFLSLTLILGCGRNGSPDDNVDGRGRKDVPGGNLAAQGEELAALEEQIAVKEKELAELKAKADPLRAAIAKGKPPDQPYRIPGRRNGTGLSALGASTVGLLGSPPGEGPLLASAALIPGRTSGITAFFRWDDLLKNKAVELAHNKDYPGWYQEKYYYKVLAGADAKTNFKSNGLTFGYLRQEPKTTSSAHNHPAAEIYYIISGTAKWSVDDELNQPVGPGSIIFHRPYAVHGWVSGDEPLEALWVWWEERDSVPDVFRMGSRLTNRERDWDSERNAKPWAEIFRPR